LGGVFIKKEFLSAADQILNSIKMAILWAKDKNGADKIGSGGRRVPPK
jgi:hypothetical protein